MNFSHSPAIAVEVPEGREPQLVLPAAAQHIWAKSLSRPARTGMLPRY
ncbi:MAG: hypothetical protein KME26_07030 [Oscillatoria princeps RMCB-10]|nr:hypothetical protein [Oscillatoria princeps RMCB-10]